MFIVDGPWQEGDLQLPPGQPGVHPAPPHEEEETDQS